MSNANNGQINLNHMFTASPLSNVGSSSHFPNSTSSFPQTHVNQDHLHQNHYQSADSRQIAGQNSTHYPFYTDHNYAAPAYYSVYDTNVHNKLHTLEKDNLSLHSKVDVLIKLVNEIKQSSYVENSSDEDIAKFQQLLPLKTIEKVNEVEKKLNNVEYFKKIKKVLCLYLGNRNEVGSGVNNSYMLVDKLFDRNLFVSYTWTGSSKIGDKLPFVNLKNLIKVFFEAIYRVDNTFSLKDTEKFLQNRILKYSKTRLNSNKVRPSCRDRQQRNKTRNNNTNTTDVTVNID